MATTASTHGEGITFGPGEEDIAARVERAENTLELWARGVLTAKQVRAEMKAHGVHLLERLNPHGLPMMDAAVDGYGTITLRF